LIVDRSQKQFRLTREGRSLYEAAKDILNRYEQVSSEMQEMSQGRQRHGPRLDHRLDRPP